MYGNFIKAVVSREAEISQEESSVYCKYAPVASVARFHDSINNLVVEDKDKKDADKDKEDGESYGESFT